MVGDSTDASGVKGIKSYMDGWSCICMSKLPIVGTCGALCKYEYFKIGKILWSPCLEVGAAFLSSSEFLGDG